MKRYLFILIFVLTFSFADIASATMDLSPSSPQVDSVVITIACSVGDNWVIYDSSGSQIDASSCDPMIYPTPSNGIGPFSPDVYTIVECDSTVVLATCNESDLTDILLDTGYVSQENFEWTFADTSSFDPVSPSVIDTPVQVVCDEPVTNFSIFNEDESVLDGGLSCGDPFTSSIAQTVIVVLCYQDEDPMVCTAGDATLEDMRASSSYVGERTYEFTAEAPLLPSSPQMEWLFSFFFLFIVFMSVLLFILYLGNKML